MTGRPAEGKPCSASNFETSWTSASDFEPANTEVYVSEVQVSGHVLAASHNMWVSAVEVDKSLLRRCSLQDNWLPDSRIAASTLTNPAVIRARFLFLQRAVFLPSRHD